MPTKANGPTPAENITLHVLCGSERPSIPTSIDSIVGPLRDLIDQFDSRHQINPILSFPGTSVLHDSRTLREYSIGYGTTISMATNIQVYVRINTGVKVPVTIALHARVSGLKLVASALLDIPVPDFWFASSGGQLEDHMRLGSYPQIVPGPEIVVGVVIGRCKHYHHS